MVVAKHHALPGSVPAPVGSITVHSIDEARHTMKDGQLDLLQMSPGKLNYSLSMLQLGHIQVYRERADKPLLKRGPGWSGALVFSFVVDARGCGWLAGRAVDPQVSLVVAGEQLPEIITPQALDLLFVVVDRQWLCERIGEAASQQIAGSGLSFPSFALWHEQRLALRKLFALLPLQDATFPGQAPMHPVPAALIDDEPGRAQAEELVLDALLEVFGSVQRIEPLCDNGPKRLIDQARSLMLGDAPQRPTMSQVAAHLGVSRRYLQTCFNTAVGIPASEFVRAERLNQVRKVLVEARRAGRNLSIGDVAADWGFWHLSRFASDYRDMFGELPSHTLRPYASLSACREQIRLRSQNG
jgi:AraC family ethanolamine operon transcriptional activator